MQCALPDVPEGFDRIPAAHEGTDLAAGAGAPDSAGCIPRRHRGLRRTHHAYQIFRIRGRHARPPDPLRHGEQRPPARCRTYPASGRRDRPAADFFFQHRPGGVQRGACQSRPGARHGKYPDGAATASSIPGWPSASRRCRNACLRCRTPSPGCARRAWKPSPCRPPCTIVAAACRSTSWPPRSCGN